MAAGDVNRKIQGWTDQSSVRSDSLCRLCNAFQTVAAAHLLDPLGLATPLHAAWQYAFVNCGNVGMTCG